ncbi:MAG: oligosaccharide flippase family protein [Thermoplasmata archaeon]
MSKKLYTDLVSTSGTYLLVSSVAIIAGILFPRMVGSEEWGLWSITLGLIGILGPFAQMAMSTTLVNYISKYKKDKKKVTNFVNSAYMIAIASSFAVSLCIIAASGYLAERVFQDGRLRVFFLLGSSIIFFEQINIVNRDYFRGFKDFKKYNLLKIIPSLSVFLLSLLLLLIFSYRAIYVALAHAVIFSSVCITVFIYLHRFEPTFKISSKPGKEETRRLLRFGGPLIFTMTFITVMKSIDRILIGYYMDPSHVGIYSVASGIPWMIGSMMAPVSIVLLPTFSERKAEGRSSKLLLREVFSFLVYTSIPLILFLLLFSGDILGFVYGGDYPLGATVLSIASFEILFFGGYVLFRTSVQAAERTGAMAMGIGAAALLNIIANMVLIPLMGMEGAAVGTLLSFIMLFLFMIYMVKRDYELDLTTINIPRIILFTLVMAVSGCAVYNRFTGSVSISISSIIFAVLTLAFIHASSPLWYKEARKYIRELIFR